MIFLVCWAKFLASQKPNETIILTYQTLFNFYCQNILMLIWYLILPLFNKLNIQFNSKVQSRILKLRQKLTNAWSLWDIRIAFKKISDSSIFEEVFPSKRTKMFFGKISTYTCIQALKFRMQALFLMQNQNLKPNFRGLDFLLFLGIKSESNH